MSVSDVRNGAMSAENFIAYILSKDIYNDLVARIEHKGIVEMDLPSSKPASQVPPVEVDQLIRRSNELERAEIARRQAEWEAQRLRTEREYLESLERASSMQQAADDFINNPNNN